ncbi:MAG: site-2 protease family protein, partial [Cyanobacteria bacterium P01_A01_bin.135]
VIYKERDLRAMGKGWRVGVVFGIPLFVDPSWFFVLILVTVSYSYTWQNQGWGGLEWVAGFVMALLLFSSVLLHELGHSLVARSQGISVNSITLFLFGGVASIAEESKTPGQAFQVAIAGPSVSLVLFIILLLLSQVIPVPVAQVITERLAWVNLVLALFNLIPGLPLDGGQVLKAAVWKFTGSRIRGVRWAARSGFLLGGLAIAFGVMLYLNQSSFAFLWIALLGWFGVRSSRTYSQVADLQEKLMQLVAADAMTRDYRVADARDSLRQFADQYVLADNQPTAYFAASDGRYRGLVTIEELRQRERSQWEVLTLADIARPLEEIGAVQEQTPLSEVILTLESSDNAYITVLSPAGSVAGVIDRGDIVRTVAKQMKLPVPEASIQQIKDDQAYPPGLQLVTIAQGLTKDTVR